MNEHSPVERRGFSERVSRRLVIESRRIAEWLWWHGPEGRHHRQRMQKLRGVYRGRRAFVFGGGPSLRRTDVRLLRDEITIASNGIFLLFDEMGYQPTFLTVEDRLVAEDRATVLNAIHGSTKVFPRDLSYVLSADEQTVFVDFKRDYSPFPKFSGDLAKVGYWGGTVTALNLQLAFHLGCNPIVMIGFDHEYAVPETQGNVVITSQESDQNHFHPSYFGPGFRWHDPRLDRMEASYREALRFCTHEGVSILNATDGGKLEIFPRVKFSELVAQGSPNL